MKYIFFILLLISGTCYGQTKYYIRADTTVLEKVGSNNELNLLNSTRSRTGAYLKNINNGRTGFFYAVDSAYISGSNLVLVRGGGTQNVTVAVGGSGGANVKLSSPFLKGSGDSISLIPIFRQQLSNNDQSSYITSLAWTQQTADVGGSWNDGSLMFSINDSLFKVFGFNAVTVTDSIFASANNGKTWAFYGRYNYSAGNVASIKAKQTGGWNYIFGHTSDNTYKKYVTRFKNMYDVQVMTINAEWGNILLYGVCEDDNGNLYLFGGQTDNTDIATAVMDVWYSTAQSGGANWTKILDNFSLIGGCLIDQVVFRDGNIYIINSGNKMGGAGVRTNTVLKVPAIHAGDSTKYKYIDTLPAEAGNKLFVTTEVFKGNIFIGLGNVVGSVNTNGMAYIDKDDIAHPYYAYYGKDSITPLPIGHAADFVVHKNYLILGPGNAKSSVDRLADTTFQTPGNFRQSVSVANRTQFAEIPNSLRTFIGNGVRVSTTSNDEIVRTTTDNFNSWLTLSTGAGFKFGYLTPSNSTINVPIAQGTGAIGEWNTAGMLQIGYSTLGAATRLYNYGNAYFDGNNTNAALGWSHNGSTPTGQLTGVSGQAWVTAFTGSDLRFAANNGTPNVVLTTTGLQVGNNTTATNVLHINGLPRIVTSAEQAGRLLMSDANGVADWSNVFVGQSYVFGAAGSGSAGTVTIHRGLDVYGNSVYYSMGWGDNSGAGVVGKLTYGSSLAIVTGNTGINLGLAANNGGNTLLITATGLGIGASSAAAPVASAVLDVVSTTQGVLFPRMTTTEKNAISSPAEGLVIYDLTLHKLCVYTGSAWETITSL